MVIPHFKVLRCDAVFLNFWHCTVDWQVVLVHAFGILIAALWTDVDIPVSTALEIRFVVK